MNPLLVAGGTLALSEALRPRGDAGEAAIQNAIAQFSSIRPPSAEDLQVILQKLVYQGDITPEDAQTFIQSPSAMEAISGSPEAKSAQLQSLAQLSGIATGGGVSPQEEADLERVRARNASNERGSREAILQNARERGVSGSGTELLDQMVASQGAAGNANQEALDVAAQQRERTLQAIAQTGQLGGQIEGQTFGEQAAKAAAADAINKFNAANKNATEATNVATRNAAAARNQETKQTISDTNTGLTNEQAQLNAQAKQQAFNNAIARAGGMTGQLGALASNQLENRKAQLGFTGAELGATGTILSKSDVRMKKGVAPVPEKELDDFMRELNPKSYEYKDPESPGAADGENVGVLAQDVEKTPVGRTMVKNTKDGKMLDLQKGFEVILAAIGALHNKLESEKEPENA